MTCYHPPDRRRIYRTDVGECQVCYSCLAVRSDSSGYWLPVCRRYEPPDLFTADGALICPDYWAAYDRAPVPA